MDVGLNVEFDGKKNIVMEGDVIKEYPIGGMICEYARLRPTEIKAFIMENSYFEDTDLKENGGRALMNFYEAMKEKLDIVTAIMVLTDFSNLMADFNRASDEELKALLDSLDATETHQIKSYILENTGFEEYGISTIGQALLSAYAGFANCYVPFKHSFDIN